MDDRNKEDLLEEIESLMAYGGKKPSINPALLAYLDLDSLISIRDRLKEKSSILKEEDRVWIQQFRKEE